MPDEHAQPGEHGQEHRQTIDEADRDRATDGNEAATPDSSLRVWREGVLLPVDVMGVFDGRMLDDRAEAICRGRDQIVAPRGGRVVLPSIDKLPRGLEALALGGVHRRLPPDVHPRPKRTIQAAGRERKGDSEQAQRERTDHPGWYCSEMKH